MTMSLLSLKVRNFLRIEAAEITPDGAVVEISGANEALIEVDLEELRIKLVIRPDRSTVLTVTNAEGFKASSPQKLLDGLYSKLIDPLAFARLTPKQQRDTVAEMAGLSAMLDELADVNRDLKAAQARLDAMPEVAAVEPVDVSATLAEIRDAREENRVAEALAARLAQLQSQAAGAREVAERKRAQAHALLVEAEQCDGQASVLDASASLIVVPAAVDLTPLERRLEDAETINAQARAYADREFLAKTVADYAAESQALTDALTAREAERKAVIEAADLPIDGLGFGDDCIMFNGVPFDQASNAEQLRISAAIAMAMNPKLRVLIVREGSLMDASSLRMLTEMAEERGFLVLAETVDESGDVGVYIEEGRVAAVNGQAVAA
ncbi:MAG: hypothetical protein HEQ38_17185 [Gemmatimonas sp.]|nr:hypothetical protein [Gemmatimonas sp.]